MAHRKRKKLPRLLRPDVTEIVLTMVKNERVRQDMEQGIQSWDEDEWMQLVAEAFNNIDQKLREHPDKTQLLQLIQATATLVAWMEDEYVRLDTKQPKARCSKKQDDAGSGS